MNQLASGFVRVLFIMAALPLVGCESMESALTNLGSNLDSAGKKDVIIHSFYLMDPITGANLLELNSESEIDLNGFTGELAIRADASSQTESVEFSLGTETTLDNEYPFEFSFTAAPSSLVEG